MTVPSSPQPPPFPADRGWLQPILLRHEAFLEFCESMSGQIAEFDRENHERQLEQRRARQAPEAPPHDPQV